MELIYQGVKYSNTIQYDDGATFVDTPAVRLYSPSTKKYYEATVTATPSADAGTSYDFVFSTSLTASMKRGMYYLEIYNSAKNTMLERIDGFRVVPSGNSSDSSSGVSNS